MSWLQKIQNQPENIRKIIFWVIIIIIGGSLLIIWARSLKETMESFEVEQLKQDSGIPIFEQDWEKFNMPTPDMSQEELKKLEELLKEAQNSPSPSPSSTPLSSPLEP